MSRFILGFVAGLATVGLILVSVGHILAVEDPLAPADAIVALSGDQGPRTATAVDLYKRGLAPLVVFAGSSEDPASLPSAELMKREAVRRGVPAQRVLTETRSATTQENAARVADLLAAQEIRSVILVTSPYHQRRAALLFERRLAPKDIALRNYPARDPAWDRTNWWTREPARSLTVTELAKLGVEVMGSLLRRSD